MHSLPTLALSVRQPWAWAIIAGHKKIENRTAGAIRSGNMVLGHICIHAATGLKQDEFRWGHWRLGQHGVACPRPEDLIRGAIIGTVDVVDIIDHSDSEWFGGPMGLVMENPTAIDPIPAKGALGYFNWQPADATSPILPWMKRFDLLTHAHNAPGLFDDMPMSFKTTPRRPTRKS